MALALENDSAPRAAGVAGPKSATKQAQASARTRLDRGNRARADVGIDACNMDSKDRESPGDALPVDCEILPLGCILGAAFLFQREPGPRRASRP